MSAAPIGSPEPPAVVPPALVLASGSPRRRQLLEMLGIPHGVEPAEIAEAGRPGEAPEDMAARLAREKALAVAGRFPGGLVLGADTVVVLGNEVLGKPVTPSEAEGMLSRLAGKGHRVITAVALARDDRVLEERLDATRVWFRPVSADFIRDYVATGEPLDKAGSYGLQGLGALLVERIDGDFYGVMGLPVRLVVEMLAAVGLPYRFTR